MASADFWRATAERRQQQLDELRRELEQLQAENIRLRAEIDTLDSLKSKD
jgi:cell division protein FtsB